MKDSRIVRDHRSEFRPVAAAYRTCKKNIVVPVIIACLAVIPLLATKIFKKYFVIELSIAAGLFIISYVVLLMNCVRLTCPACGRRANNKRGSFCPECGNEGMLIPKFWQLSYPRCPACRKTMILGKYSCNFKVHYCRSCGVYLDEEGL